MAKKMSLDEARKYFGVKDTPKKTFGNKKKTYSQSKTTYTQSYNSVNTKKRIEQLERKIEHDDLTPDQEMAILDEIEKLEKDL